MPPGEEQQPMFILNDKFYEELRFSHLFVTMKYGYQVQRDKNLSQLKYFNQSQKFALDAVYVFFVRNVLQNKNMVE